MHFVSKDLAKFIFGDTSPHTICVFCVHPVMSQPTRAGGIQLWLPTRARRRVPSHFGPISWRSVEVRRLFRAHRDTVRAHRSRVHLSAQPEMDTVRSRLEGRVRPAARESQAECPRLDGRVVSSGSQGENHQDIIPVPAGLRMAALAGREGKDKHRHWYPNRLGHPRTSTVPD